MDMMKMGFIDPNKGLAMMDMGGVDKLYNELKADERQAKRENLKLRSLEVQEIIARLNAVANAKQQAEMFMQQQQIATGTEALQQQQTPTPDIPPEFADAQQTMAMQEQPQMQELPMIKGDAGFGQDLQSQAPLVPSESIVSVNTWDNHQIHIEVHNLFRKSQAFDILPDLVKQQFEAHVQLHALALNQAAMNAQIQMPAPPMDNPFAGAHNGSGTPVGSNQFGPPGTENGVMPNG